MLQSSLSTYLSKKCGWSRVYGFFAPCAVGGSKGQAGFRLWLSLPCPLAVRVSLWPSQLCSRGSQFSAQSGAKSPRGARAGVTKTLKISWGLQFNLLQAETPPCLEQELWLQHGPAQPCWLPWTPALGWASSSSCQAAFWARSGVHVCPAKMLFCKWCTLTQSRQGACCLTLYLGK